MYSTTGFENSSRLIWNVHFNFGFWFFVEKVKLNDTLPCLFVINLLRILFELPLKMKSWERESGSNISSPCRVVFRAIFCSISFKYIHLYCNGKDSLCGTALIITVNIDWGRKFRCIYSYWLTFCFLGRWIRIWSFPLTFLSVNMRNHQENNLKSPIEPDILSAISLSLNQWNWYEKNAQIRPLKSVYYWKGVWFVDWWRFSVT